MKKPSITQFCQTSYHYFNLRTLFSNTFRQYYFVNVRDRSKPTLK